MTATLGFLLIAIIAFFVGIGIGALVVWLVMSSRAEKKNSAQAPRPKAEEKDGEPVEAARILRDRLTGRLVVELEGKRLKAAHQLNAAQHESLVKLWDDLRNWLGKPAASTQAQTAPAASEVVTPLSGGPVDMLVRALQTDVKVPAAERSIAAQIDEILQRRLAGKEFAGSALAAQNIRLVELPGQRMVVMVGKEQFAGIEEVPDPEIKTLIRSCVVEWEKQSG